MATIKDSGNRTEFESGAVRDIQVGKGRCDLLPLDVVGVLTNDGVIHHLATFKEAGDALWLEGALKTFTELRGWDLSTMLLEVSKHFAEGAEKYSEDNWMKGIPLKSYLNSSVRHYLKYLRGDNDEPHDRAFCWNIICAMWTCKHKPELNDYATKECLVCGEKIHAFAKSCDNCMVYQQNDTEENLCELEEEF